MLRALGHAGLEAELLCLDCQLVVEEELGVAQGGGLQAKKLLKLVGVLLHLCSELVGIVLRGKRVGVGHSYELDALGVSQCLERVNHLRNELLEHLQHLARDSESAVELATAEADHLLQRLAQREVRGGCQVLNLILALHVLVVVVVGTDIKETITFHAERCVHLEAKTYIFHKAIILCDLKI